MESLCIASPCLLRIRNKGDAQLAMRPTQSCLLVVMQSDGKDCDGGKGKVGLEHGPHSAGQRLGFWAKAFGWKLEANKTPGLGKKERKKGTY
jgi:hypothetical protein